MASKKSKVGTKSRGQLDRLVRACVICGARIRNINPLTKTCSPPCTRKMHGKPEPDQYMGPVCQHCGRATTDEEGTVCDDCYSHYTVAMLNDMDQ